VLGHAKELGLEAGRWMRLGSHVGYGVFTDKRGMGIG